MSVSCVSVSCVHATAVQSFHLPNKAPFWKLYVRSLSQRTWYNQPARKHFHSLACMLSFTFARSAVLVHRISLRERDSLHLGWPGSNREAHTLGTNGNGRRLTFDYTQVLDCDAGHLVSVPHTLMLIGLLTVGPRLDSTRSLCVVSAMLIVPIPTFVLWSFCSHSHFCTLKFLFPFPLRFILASFYTEYNFTHFIVNLVALAVAVVPKFPVFHRFRPFRINKYWLCCSDITALLNIQPITPSALLMWFFCLFLLNSACVMCVCVVLALPFRVQAPTSDYAHT